jgi:hypothetical protein
MNAFGLQGVLASELALLSGLSYVDLGNNLGISGTLPREISTLSLLTYL